MVTNFLKLQTTTTAMEQRVALKGDTILAEKYLVFLAADLPKHDDPKGIK